MRRRPFRRGRPQRIPPALQRANALMDAGRHAQAAAAFEKIARRADARRGPRAPIFHLRAGQAYALAGDIDNAMPHLMRGLSATAAHRRWDKLHQFGQRAMDALNELGFNAQAQEIADYLATTLPKHSTAPAPVQQTDSRLPTHCPGCGAPLRADEVDWIDQVSAECLYCGSPVQKES